MIKRTKSLQKFIVFLKMNSKNKKNYRLLLFAIELDFYQPKTRRFFDDRIVALGCNDRH